MPLVNVVPLTDVAYQTGAQPPSVAHLFGTDLATATCSSATLRSRISILVALVGAERDRHRLGGRGDLRADRRTFRPLDDAGRRRLNSAALAAGHRHRGDLPRLPAGDHHGCRAHALAAERTTDPRGCRRRGASLPCGHHQGFTRALLRYHALPRLANQLSVAFGLLIPHAIWHESTLTFLGLGLPPHQPSLGSLLNLGQQALLTGSWWTLAAPAGLLVVTTVAITALIKPKEQHHG